MAKLKQYDSFEKLKLDFTSSPGSLKKHQEMESFLKLLRSKMLEKKAETQKNKGNINTDGAKLRRSGVYPPRLFAGDPAI